MKTSYDFSSLNDFFNLTMPPEQIANDLLGIIFSYAECYNEDDHRQINRDMFILHLIYEQLTKIKPISER